MSSKVYSGIFTKQEIDSIIEFFESRPIATQDEYSKNKNLEYQSKSMEQQ
jgi:hypothetical protein